MRAKLGSLAGIFFLFLGVWLLARHLSLYDPADLWRGIKSLPMPAIWKSVGLATLSLWAMIQFDVVAVRWLGVRLSYRRIALAGFIGGVFGRTLGFPLVTTTGVRYRLFRAWGMSKAQFGELLVLYFASLWLGFLAVAGAALIFRPLPLPVSWAAALPSTRWLGGVLLLPVVLYMVLSVWRNQPFKFLKFQFSFPTPQVAVSQVGLSGFKWFLNAATLYVLLAALQPLNIFHFCAVYFAAQIVAIASHAPGGYAVFDASFLMMLDGHMPVPAVVSALVAYRAIYNLLPLLVALPLYVAAEARLLSVKR